jgi:RNA polymerase sigma-70 factor, ECF subfamily
MSAVAAGDLDRIVVELRPKLHRYCARMVGSAIDGEDVLQDALMKAVEAFPAARAIANLEGWLFRIAHNTALDFLRRRARLENLSSGEDADMIADPTDPVENRQVVAASLRTFMRLPVAQRSTVILMDVLGHSLREICDIMEISAPAAKAALHRGRTRLRELAGEPDDLPHPVLPERDRARLAAYVRYFNARDFDAIRASIADDVRLELVNRQRLNGRAEVSRYFGNYSKTDDWHLVPGLVDRRPAVLVFDPGDASPKPKYFMLLNWTSGRLAGIRDFRYAAYAMEGAEYLVLPPEQPQA